jgi:hypothetical protein
MRCDPLCARRLAGFCAVSNTLPVPRTAETSLALYPRDNGMNATIREKLHCVAAEPHATFVRVNVVDGRQQAAYEVAVLGRLRSGYRILQMRSPLGTRIECCYLFIKVSLGSEHNMWMSQRQVCLRPRTTQWNNRVYLVCVHP